MPCSLCDVHSSGNGVLTPLTPQASIGARLAKRLNEVCVQLDGGAPCHYGLMIAAKGQALVVL